MADKQITGITTQVARDRSNQNPDIEPLYGRGNNNALTTQLMNGATSFYRDSRGKILPAGVVFIPDHGSAGLASHNIQNLVPPGGRFVYAADGGVYVQLPPDHPWWSQHPEYQAADAGSANPASGAYPDDGQIAQGLSDYDAARNQFFNGGGNATLGGVDMGSTTDPLGIAGQSAQAGANGAYGTKTTRGPDGAWKVLAGDGQTDLTNSYFGQQMQANQQANATFSALALPQSYNQSTSVMFSQGAGGLTPQGTQVVRTPQGFSYTSKQDDRQDLQAGSRGLAQNQPMNSAQQQAQAQHMTLGQGLQWFVNLSVTDPQAYSQLVVNLNKAGYFSTQSGNMNYLPENQLPLSGYSRNAGLALVEAMQDLSVAQGAGETADMATWLQKRSNGYEDYINSGAGYNAVNRSYQDPATLALTAKSAAAQALGRNLTPAEEAKFEAAFRGKENAAFNEMDTYGRAKAIANFTQKSGLPAGTPTGYTMPDASGEADQYVNQNPQFAAEKQGYAGLELTKGLIGFLKGGGF